MQISPESPPAVLPSHASRVRLLVSNAFIESAALFGRLCGRWGLGQPSLGQSPTFFHWLDLLRGLAAFAVLFWHYQHFYILDRTQEPLYAFFWPLYEYGDWAVQLFWVLSGFVFAHVYSTTPTSARKFFLARFARLYPLHFITLIVVAVLQFVNMKVFGHFLLYQYNDLYHFILNLLFIPHWSFQVGRSFNAPVWSVSVELLIYIIFWLSLPFLIHARRYVSLLMALGMAGLYFGGAPAAAFWQCGLFFFIGTTLYVWTDTTPSPKRMLFVATGMLGGLGCVAVLMEAPLISLQLTLLSFIVAGVALLDIYRVRSFEATRVLGNMSYGLYLWHIPVQLVLMLGLQVFSIDTAVTKTVPFFILFMVVVVGLAHISFVAIEMPLRTWIRART